MPKFAKRANDFGNQVAPEYWFHNVWYAFWESLTPEGPDLYIDERMDAALAYMSAEQWGDWVYTTRKFDPEYRQRFYL
ncbi:hypothetical protein BN2475_1250026 [Paraburkholderia ribeironis]|uniref:Uncharacterized protein n=1 Tax=Paraburkholderia ribeironis TaxID=1247936 RepID=A0A1N7SNV0_9BURK|nr:hypothetical protein [Paraburkholderia ribeironis]SIT49094.1 hypothetical protein BN2475_1250026 [Paraburkholderia ribeironis]